ncbi:hypothetical protein B2J93_3427 [Marssonina coronariae]|uniref:Glucose receptor Git3-like N-terminal domain-containing protein n=1 Tax=Diplocarpon coronariae TaxID=2795749 RepID=A0A218Z3E9_9HELO|nr:hypothetical protein B2J93_3427 [Marssonina coronariae]
MVDFAVAIPTLVGSYLSMFAAGSILICYFVLPSQSHFRHTLIINLACADFFNALNNSISGSYVMVHKHIPAGATCSLNGLVGQLTVQATDFSILFITIATVLTLRRWNYEPKITRLARLLITSGIWLVPIATSTVGLGLNAYQPVSGNWCWISSHRTLLRLALGHGWRLLIIIATICLYAYLFIYIHRHFASLRSKSILSNNYSETAANLTVQSAGSITEVTSEEIHVHDEFEIRDEPFDVYWNVQFPEKELQYFEFVTPEPALKRDVQVNGKKPPQPLLNSISQNFDLNTLEQSLVNNKPSPSSHRFRQKIPLLKTRDPLAIVRRPPPPSGITVTIETAPSADRILRAREKQILKLLFFNAYPIAYVLLWVPGFINRFVEYSGNSSRGLAIAQASTQYVGLANAFH